MLFLMFCRCMYTYLYFLMFSMRMSSEGRHIAGLQGLAVRTSPGGAKCWVGLPGGDTILVTIVDLL